MDRKQALAALAFGAPVVAAVPAAQAATFTVQAGEASRRGLPASAVVNRYMPAAVEVHAGDTVEFKGGALAPHTVTFLGGAPYGRYWLVGEESAGSLYPAVADAGGVAFPYAGRPRRIYNVAAFAPAGGAVVDSRRRYVNAGLLPSAGKPGVRYRFPRAGTYAYTCLLHPGMTGRIVVRPKAAEIPEPAAVAALAAAQGRRMAAAARALVTAPVPPNTVVNGPATRVAGGDANLFMMKPARLTVPVGTTVAFRTESNTDMHNVALGPADYLAAYVRAQNVFPGDPSGGNNVPGDIVHGSEGGDPASNAPFPYDGTNHGNGFLSLQATDSSPRTFARQTQRITFTRAGEYTIYCLLHFPDMTSTVTVEP